MTKKKGKQKSTKSIGASLTPDYRIKEEKLADLMYAFDVF